MVQPKGGLGATPKTTKSALLFKSLDLTALNFRPADSLAARDHGNTSLPGNEFMLAAVSSSLSMPGFWLERPATWFNMCELVYVVRQITSSVTKYHHCVGKLPAGRCWLRWRMW